MKKNNPYNQLSNHELFSGILNAVYSLTPGRESGSHTHIFVIDAARLETVFKEWVETIENHKTWETKKKTISNFAIYISSRFLLKVGKTENFTMRLGGAKPLEVPRALVSEIFGAIGYSLFPTWRKTIVDSTEAIREIPYFYQGNPNQLFFPHFGDILRKILGGEIKNFPKSGPKGLFLVYSIEKEETFSYYDFASTDKYASIKIENRGDFIKSNAEIRHNALDRKTLDVLRNYFNAPVTVGVRDTLRWLNGARHPKLDWDEARAIIDDCFSKHGNDNFLLPEQTFYLPSRHITPENYKNSVENNNKFIKAAAKSFYLDMNSREKHFFNETFIEELMADLFKYHHDYPRYKLDETMGYFNPAMIRLGMRFLFNLGLFLTRIKFPERKNGNLGYFLRQSGWEEKINDKLVGKYRKRFIARLTSFVLTYDLDKGLLVEGKRLEYKRINSTFFTIQERAGFLPANCKKIDQFSLEDLAKTEYSHYLRTYPELSEKLVVFFTLVLRFFNDTDFVPDLRPDEAGINIFILGIWGYVTENLIITIYEDKDGKHDFRIKFVDNKDHFKQYKRELDKDNPLGMAKHAMRIVHPVVLPAMLRAIGNFVQIVHENKNGLNPQRVDLKGLMDYTMSVAQEIIIKGVENSTNGVQTILSDTFDDAKKIAEKTISNIIDDTPKTPEI